MDNIEKQQAQLRRMNIGAHLQKAAKAMELASNADTWDRARTQMRQAAKSLEYAATTVMAP